MWRGLSVLEPSQEVREAFLHGSQAPFLLLALGTCFLADQARVGACSLRGQLDLPQTVCQSCKLLFPPPNDHIHIAGCDRGGGNRLFPLGLLLPEDHFVVNLVFHGESLFTEV